MGLKRTLYLLLFSAFIQSQLIYGQGTSEMKEECNYFTTLITDYPDPFVVYDETIGVYILTGTGGPGITIKSSPTLEGLRSAKKVQIYFPERQEGPDQLLWAPEIHKLNDKWYVYFTGHRTGEKSKGIQSKQRMHVLECTSEDPVSGEWIYKGKIGGTEQRHGIDGTVFELNDQLFYVWSGPPKGFPIGQSTWIAPMINPWTLGDKWSNISKVGKAWEGTVSFPIFGVMEGQQILRSMGKVYLAYSTFGYLDDRYRIGMLVMDEHDDPMDKKSWTKMKGPVFEQNPEENVFSTGHHCFFKSPDGTEYWFMYHARSTSIGMKRKWSPDLPLRYCRAQPLSFDANGTPVFGTAVNGGTTQCAPSGEQREPSHKVLDNGSYFIRNKQSGLYLKIENCNPERGGQLIVDSLATSKCSVWRVQAIQKEDNFTISAEYGGMMLVASASDNPEGYICQTWGPSGQEQQHWVVTKTDTIGQFVLQNSDNGSALSAKEGNRVSSELPNATSGQLWEFVPFSD